MSSLPTGTGSLFTPKQESLSELLPKIHAHQTALPDFQRPWIWEPEMVRDLLLSVAYRYPAGSLLTMPVFGDSSTFALRPFQGSEISGSTQFKTTPNLMVLDGQQRLTSLYQATFSDGGVAYDGRVYWFYLDVAKLLALPVGADLDDAQFDAALFYVLQEKTGKRVRYANLRPLYEVTTPQLELEHGALPLRLVFDPFELNAWMNQYLQAQALRSQASDTMQKFIELGNIWSKFVQAWVDRIRTYPFPIVELKPNVPLSAICHIFEKVNSKGVPLDVFDLCTAILWAQGFRLNKEWEAAQKGLAGSYYPGVQPLQGTWFLQGISLLDSYNRIPRVVLCRRQDLLKLSYPVVYRWWNALLEGYKEASAFMTDQGIIAERILPYSTLIVPLTAILAQVRLDKGAAHTGAAWPKIAQWYWCSVFSQRYSSRVETASAQDFEQVMAWINGGNEPDVVRTFSFRPEALEEITSIRNAIYKAILCLLTREGARDFGGSGSLSTNLFFSSKQDHHHIYPTKALEDAKIQDPRTDSIVNKTLISSGVNQSIGGRKPSDYVAAWRDKLGQSQFDANLSSHAVDADILASDDWNAFAADRREKLRLLIEKACGKPVSAFTLPTTSPALNRGVASTISIPTVTPSAGTALTGMPSTVAPSTGTPPMVVSPMVVSPMVVSPMVTPSTLASFHTADDEAKEEAPFDTPTIADEELAITTRT